MWLIIVRWCSGTIVPVWTSLFLWGHQHAESSLFHFQMSEGQTSQFWSWKQMLYSGHKRGIYQSSSPVSPSYNIAKYSLFSQMRVAACSSLLDSPPRQTPPREPLWFKKPLNDLHGKNNISNKRFLQTALCFCGDGRRRRGGPIWVDAVHV